MRFDELLDRLEISPATLKRDLKYLREQLGTPVEYDAFERTYQLSDSPRRSRQELPGIWLGEEEFHALVLAQRLLEEVDPSGGVSPRLRSVVQWVQARLARPGPQRELERRIRLVARGRREVDPQAFDSIMSALTQRRRLRLNYFTRGRHTLAVREVSPQRLFYLRAWYLDAWCETESALRRFPLEAVQSAYALDLAAIEVPLDEVERQMDGGYGAFAGPARQWALLRFSARSSPWAAREEWHPLQRTQTRPDGRLELSLPYDDPAELVMDILRWGDDVEVVDGPALREAVAARALAIARLYRRPARQES